MKPQNVIARVSDTIDLLKMLETLTSNLSKGAKSNATTIPWPGVQLTLSQSISILNSVVVDLAKAENADQIAEIASGGFPVDRSSFEKRRIPVNGGHGEQFDGETTRANGIVRELVPKIKSKRRSSSDKKLDDSAQQET